jgi:hypothetical protein
VPSESLLLSGPGLLLAQPASAGGASSRHPAVGHRRRSRHRQDARRGVGRQCPACGVHPSGFGVQGPAVQPSSVRPSGVQPSGVRSPGVVVRGPAVRPSGVHPSSVQRSGVHPSGASALVSTRPASSRRVSARRSGRVRLLPHWTGALGPGWCRGGNRHRRNRSRSRWLPCRRARSTAQQAWGGRRCRGRTLVSGVAGGLAGWVRAAAALDRLSDRAGQAGVRSAGGWRRREGTAAGCGAGWPPRPRGCRRGLGGRPRCVVVVEPAAWVDGPGGASGRAGGDGRAAPARPRQAMSAPGSLPTAP